MTSIELIKMNLVFFKGIKDLEINFERNTNIYGDNGTGKTSIFDAFTWLLFGKDHNDSQKFEIKTLDSDNRAIEKVDHEVEAVLLINEVKTTVKRTYREKWVKKRGSTEAELTGHETVYFWNDVPLNQKEFQSKISSIINESTFKLATNPLYFNSMKWQDRRALLSTIAGDVTNEEVSKDSEDFKKLLVNLSNKTLDEYKKEVVARKKKIQKELEQIPTRIDEVQKSLPKAQNWAEIETEIQNKENAITSIDAQLHDQSKISENYYKEIESIQKKLHALKSQKSDFEFKARQDIQKGLQEKDSIISTIQTDISRLSNEISSKTELLNKTQLNVESNNTKLQELRDHFSEQSESQLKIDKNAFVCPTCKRAFEDADIEAKKAELTENFNLNKAYVLAEINTKGKTLKGKNENLNLIIGTLTKEIEEANKVLKLKQSEIDKIESTPADIQSTQSILKDNDTYQDVNNQIVEFEKELKEKEGHEPNSDNETLRKLKFKKSDLQASINSLKSTLAVKTQIEQANTRISDLNKQSKELAQDLADAENEEFTITAFISVKIAKVEEAVNKLFPSVQFKMFCEQLNGGSTECCETLINGVPYSDANNAAKIQTGIEIINVLSKHYDFYAPIFIDNAESVTKLPTAASQIIRLVVEKGTEILTIK